MPYHRSYCLIIFLCITQISHAQKFKWLKSYGSKRMVEVVTGLITEKNGNSVFLLNCTRIDTAYNDTLIIGNNSYSFTGRKHVESYILRVDSSGNLINHTRLGKFDVAELRTNNNGAYFLAGEMDLERINNTGVTEINGVNYKNDSGMFIFARLDSNFNFIWITQTGNKYGQLIIPGFTGKSCTPLSFSENKLLFNVLCSGTTRIGSTKYTFGNGLSPVFGSIDPVNGKIIWSNYLYNDYTPNYYGNEICYISKVLSRNNILYLSFNNGADIFNINSDNFYSQTSHMIRTDSLGRYIDRLEFDANVLLRDFQIFNNKIFFSGIFGNIVHFGNKTINLQRTSGGNYYESFVACVSASLQPLWFYTPTVKSGGSIGSYITHLIINDSFLYLNGISLCDLMIGETSIKNGNFTAKLDLRGNVLWASFGGGYDASAKCISAIPNKGVFIGGAFIKTMHYGTDSIVSKGPVCHDGFLLKVLDNVIFRGNVTTGPYCAGDSIYIPYHKVGIYDTSNIFRAQLSNGNGNFDSGYYDLGQIKSNDNGIIRGILPRFNISTSSNYRIRIVSTSPFVESYFRADTLRLLIFSKDRADAGKDTTICNGRSVTLKTSGGSLWNWSPNYQLSNTSKSVTTASPKTTTTYRVIISDSSGCGITDTAFVTINVKKPLKIVSTISDTALCPGTQVLLPVKFLYGDSLNYNWAWYEQVSNGYKKIQYGFQNDKDVLSYIMSGNSSNIQKFRLILKDNCTVKSDTANFIIRLRSAPELFLNSMDTVLCKGNSYTWKAKATGGYPPGYRYIWTDATTGQQLSTADTLRITANSTKKITVSLSDYCLPYLLDASFIMTVNPPLNFNIFYPVNIPARDTVLCFGQSVMLYTKGSGGKGSNYSYDWKIDNVSISRSDTLMFNTQDYFSTAGGIKALTLEVNDNCTVLPFVSKRINITVLPKASAAITFPDTVCFNNRAIFKITAAGGKSPYQFKWTDENNVLVGNADSLIIDNNNSLLSGTIKRIVTVKAACLGPDTFTTLTEFLKPFSAALTPADTCLTGPVLLNIHLHGGKGNYKIEWFKDNLFLGSGVTSQIATPGLKHSQYIAVVTDGCMKKPDTLRVNLTIKPEVKLTVDGFCFGKTSFAYAHSSVGAPYIWQVDNKSVSYTDSILSMNFASKANHKVIVSTDTSLLCKAHDTINLNIIDQPRANFSYQRLNDFSLGISFQFSDRSTYVNAWQWRFGTTGNATVQHPQYTFNDTGYTRVQLIASNQNICFDTAVQYIPVFDRIQFFFPNALGADGNGVNGAFGLHPGQYYLVSQYHLEIFNRWGEMLFKSDEVRETWRGTTQGVYLYKVIITDIFGEKQEISGAVEVLR